MDESAEGMSHAAKEGAVIYSGAFVGALLSDCMFYCSEFCYLNLWHNCAFWIALDSFVSMQLSRHVKHLSMFKFQPSFPFFFLSVFFHASFHPTFLFSSYVLCCFLYPYLFTFPLASFFLLLSFLSSFPTATDLQA